MKLDAVFMNGIYPRAVQRRGGGRDRGSATNASGNEAATARAGATGGAAGGDLGAHPRDRRTASSWAGLAKGSGQTVVELPFLFEPQLDMAAVEQLADRIEDGALNVGELLEGKRICICAGSGGVGKTTTSAAIAMGMAAQRQEGRGADDRPGQAAGELARACSELGNEETPGGAGAVRRARASR